MPNPLKSEATRAYVYRVLVAAAVVAVAYGLITTEEAALWAGLVGTLFVLPAANTSTERPYGETH